MSEEKLGCGEKIFSKSSFVLGIISIVIAFVPAINYLAIVISMIAIVLGLFGLSELNRKKVAIIGIVFGIISIVVTYLIINFKQEYLFDNIRNINSEINDSENTDSEDVLKNQVDVIIGDYEQSNELVEDDFYVMPYNAKLPVTLKNKSNEIKSFNISIEAIDENGNRITVDNVYVEKLRPGQSYKTETFTYSTGDMLEKLSNAKFVVLDASSY